MSSDRTTNCNPKSQYEIAMQNYSMKWQCKTTVWSCNAKLQYEIAMHNHTTKLQFEITTWNSNAKQHFKIISKIQIKLQNCYAKSKWKNQGEIAKLNCNAKLQS